MDAPGLGWRRWPWIQPAPDPLVTLGSPSSPDHVGETLVPSLGGPSGQTPPSRQGVGLKDCARGLERPQPRWGRREQGVWEVTMRCCGYQDALSHLPAWGGALVDRGAVSAGKALPCPAGCPVRGQGWLA